MHVIIYKTHHLKTDKFIIICLLILDIIVNVTYNLF